jgi:excisionase family DNA binding protein
VYLSIEEAAEVMSLSTKTIRRRISDGSIPAYRCGRRNIRIRLDKLEAAFRKLAATGPWWTVGGHARQIDVDVVVDDMPPQLLILRFRRSGAACDSVGDTGFEGVTQDR